MANGINKYEAFKISIMKFILSNMKSIYCYFSIFFKAVILFIFYRLFMSSIHVRLNGFV